MGRLGIHTRRCKCGLCEAMERLTITQLATQLPKTRAPRVRHPLAPISGNGVRKEKPRQSPLAQAPAVPLPALPLPAAAWRHRPGALFVRPDSPEAPLQPSPPLQGPSDDDSDKENMDPRW